MVRKVTVLLLFTLFSLCGYGLAQSGDKDILEAMLDFPSEQINVSETLASELPVEGEDDELSAVVAQASAALKLGKIDYAMTLLNKVLEQDPNNKTARFAKSSILINKKRHTEAVEILERLMEEHPDDYHIKNNLGWLYATAEDHSIRNGSRAVYLAQDALLLQPNDFHVWSTLSEAYYISGQYEKALRAANEALDIGKRFGANKKTLRNYALQIEKCRSAVEAMTLLE